MAQRLIDADALKDDILKSAVMIDDRGIQTGYEIAIELIKRQPTVEPSGLTGWVCPICGRGLSPFTSVCPCQGGKGWEITCG